jgi:uncharacterized SAM-binding protein YcdF (DUF218 family)
MFYLKKIASALVLPPFSLFLLTAIGLVLMRRRRRLGLALATTALAILILCSVPLVGNALLRSVEFGAPISRSDLAGAEAIVILAGGKYNAAPEYGADTVNRYTLERIRYGAELQRRSGLPLMVSGGAPFGGVAEAETMRETLAHDFGIEVRWSETASRDTAENAALSAPMLRGAGVRRIALVSQAWHLRRSVELFAAQGFEVIPAPVGFATDSENWLENLLPDVRALERSSIAAHEWLGKLVQAAALK